MTGREASLPGQIDQVRSDLSWPEEVRRFPKTAGEPDDLRDIHTLRVQRQVRIWISSIMRRRSGLIDNSFARRPAPNGAAASSRR
jgi:hypothetical protein